MPLWHRSQQNPSRPPLRPALLGGFDFRSDRPLWPDALFAAAGLCRQRRAFCNWIDGLRTTVAAACVCRLSSPCFTSHLRIPSPAVFCSLADASHSHSSTTMPTASDVQAALAHLLSSLPPGANPFNALHKWLWTTLKHDMPKSFYIQLYILMGIFALCVIPFLADLDSSWRHESTRLTNSRSTSNFIVLAISIGLQIAYKRFWVWRVEAGSLRPHASHTWAVPIALFYPLAIFTIARSLPWYRGTGLVDEYIGLRLTM